MAWGTNSDGLPRLPCAQVVKGWDEGVARMSVGQVAKLTCSPAYAYGSQDVGDGLIPANSTLLFEMELLQIN